jgi:cytochrome c biogenesis protein CcmG/thiol:disulfide interchange protein DsbE
MAQAPTAQQSLIFHWKKRIDPPQGIGPISRIGPIGPIPHLVALCETLPVVRRAPITPRPRLPIRTFSPILPPMHSRIAAVLVLLALTCAGRGQAPEKKLWAKSFLGKPAPELQVEKWLTEKPDTKGKFVLIDFWATWCPPCRKALPELNAFNKKYGAKLAVIGISDEPEATVRKLTSPALEYACAIDTQARTKKELEVTGIPHVIIIDPKGIVRWEGFPFLDGYELNDQVIDDLLAKYGNP